MSGKHVMICCAHRCRSLSPSDRQLKHATHKGEETKERIYALWQNNSASTFNLYFVLRVLGYKLRYIYNHMFLKP